MNNIVRAHGPQHAKIAVVSDYPDNTELIKGEVLGGYAQYYLKRIFEDGVVKYNNIYYTSIIKERLDKPPKKHQNPLQYIQNNRNIEPDLELLIKELRNIKPNVVVPLGEIALQVITGYKNIRKLAGSILRPAGGFGISQFTKVIPMLHPRDLRKEYNKIFTSVVYAERAVKYANIEDFPKNDWIIRVIRNATELGDYFEQNKDQPLKVTDVETYAGFVTCIGFCCDGILGVCVPLLDDNINNLEQSLIYKLVAKFLYNNKFVNQNIGFDENQLERFGFRLGGVAGDTMLMAGTIYPELDKNLGFINSLYTEIPYFKDEGKNFNPKTNDKLYEYNAKDCISTWRIWTKQVEEAKEYKIWDFYRRGPAKFYPMYKKMENRGFRIDEEKRTKLRDKYIQMRDIYSSSVSACLGYRFNIQSTKDCLELLYNELKLPVQYNKRADGGKTPTADAKSLEYLALNHVNNLNEKDLLLNIIVVRKIDKILGYLESKAHDDGRLRTRYKIAGTKSGRTSTSQCDDYYFYLTDKGKLDSIKYGFSVQQFPKHGYELIGGEVIGDDLREMFVPSDGYRLIEWDQKQAEAVIVGALGRDIDMLHIIKIGTKEDKNDLHYWTAALVLDKLSVEVTKREREVQGKKTRHGGHYDETYETLSVQAKIPILDAKRALLKFHAANPNIRGVFQAEIAHEINNTRCLVSPHGRRRDFLGRIDAKCLREGYSYLPQCIISDNQKFGMLAIQEHFPDIEYLMEAHDGTLAEIPIGSEDTVFPIIKEVMEQPIKFEEGTFKRDPVIIRCELNISDGSWGDMREIKI